MKPNNRSKVWIHFKSDPSQPNVAVCHQCKKGLSFSGGSIGNLSRHLKRKHPVLTISDLPSRPQKKAVKTKKSNVRSKRTLNLEKESTPLESEEEDIENIEEVVDKEKEEEEPRVSLRVPSPPSPSKKSNDGVHHSQETTKDHRVLSSSSLQRVLLKIDEMVDQDEFSVFGNYIANQLKKMPMENALTCQQEIQTLTTRERLNVLRSNTKTNYYYIAEATANNVQYATTSNSEAQNEQSLCVQTQE